MTEHDPTTAHHRCLSLDDDAITSVGITLRCSCGAEILSREKSTSAFVNAFTDHVLAASRSETQQERSDAQKLRDAAAVSYLQEYYPRAVACLEDYAAELDEGEATCDTIPQEEKS